MPSAGFESANDDFDSPDQSETFDETNLIGVGDAGEARFGPCGSAALERA